MNWRGTLNRSFPRSSTVTNFVLLLPHLGLCYKREQQQRLLLWPSYRDSLRMFWFCFLGLYLLSTLACCNRPKIGHGPEGDSGCLCLWCTKETCLSCRVMFWACKSFQETGFMSFSISFLLYFGPPSSEIVLVGLNGGGPGLWDACPKFV